MLLFLGLHEVCQHVMLLTGVSSILLNIKILIFISAVILWGVPRSKYTAIVCIRKTKRMIMLRVWEPCSGEVGSPKKRGSRNTLAFARYDHG